MMITKTLYDALGAVAAVVDSPGFVGTKYDVAEKTGYDVRTVMLVLTSMWMEGILYVSKWRTENDEPLPVYARRRNGERDAPKIGVISISNSPMQSAVILRIKKLFEEGFVGSKHDVCEKVFCHMRTAERHLRRLHEEGFVYVKRWIRNKGAPIPVYALKTYSSKDARKPKAMSDAERTRLYKKRHPAVQKNYEQTKKVLEGKVRLGIWGY